MNITTIIISAVLVSIDALLVGAIVGTKQKFHFAKYALSLLIISILIFGGFLIGVFINNYINLNLTYVSGAIFLILGLKNILTKEKEDEKVLSILQLSALIFSLSLDGAILCFSTAFNYNHIIVPIVVCAVHYLFLLFGWVCFSKFTKKFKHANLISGCALILLGALKIFGIG